MAHETILLIDDDHTLLELLAGHLETAGYHPLPVSDGLSGLRLVFIRRPTFTRLKVFMS